VTVEIIPLQGEELHTPQRELALQLIDIGYKGLAAGAANATVNRELALLKRMFELAMNDGTLLVAPSIPMLAENNVRKGFFERAQFDAVCAHLTPALKAVVTFDYLTEWRVPSEVLTLEWRPVDFEVGVVKLEPGTTKNNQARTFPFGALPELRELLVAQRADLRDVLG